MSDEATQPPAPPCAHWQMLRVGDLCDAVNGRAFKSSEWRTSGVPIIRIENLKDSSAKHNYFDGDLDDRHRVRSGDLLFAWSGTPGTSFGAHLWKGSDAALNQHIFNLRIDSTRVDARYLLHALNQQVIEYVRKAQGGVGLAHITKSKFTSSWLPVAPLLEQQAIVAAIESHFSRLDAATATLERVQRNLERYRASVLKAAVEGRLVPTEAELSQKESRSYEPASVLLKRILAERRRRWEEAELAKLKAKGKPPADDRWKAGYEEPTPPDTTGLPQLPEGWCWATADALTDPTRAITYGVIKLGEEVPGGVPVLRSSNVRHLHLDIATVKCIAPDLAQEFARTTLHGGEIVVTVRGTLGGVAVVPRECAGWNVSREVAMLAVLDETLSSALAFFIAAPQIQNWLTRHEKGITYVGVNIEALRRLPIPVPPRQEALRIAEAADRSISIEAEVLAGSYRIALRMKALRQAVLKWAFEGRLVRPAPQVVQC